RRLLPQESPWTDPGRIHAAFDAVFARFRGSQLVVSYRADGVPSRAELFDLLRAHKSRVRIIEQPQQYVLSTRASRELLLIAE
ncbi:MAG: DNA methyltransferase, partial [Anaerolineae bacterium]|nr:DNA methyltransferase [Anaerolineae bacterium]